MDRDGQLARIRAAYTVHSLTFLPVNQSNSSTYQLVSSDGFDIKYLDSTEISGDYFNDTVNLGSVSIKNQQLGLALQSVRPTGIMGLGLSANVATREKYKTIVDNLVDQGFIDRAAFSLYLVCGFPHITSLVPY